MTSTRRKRTLREADIAPPEQPKENSLIHQLRNSFYFANLYQWICIFGKVVKIDDNLDIEELETECLKHGSTALQGIGLSMLKHLSSHRGLTHELFDEYTRRQFAAKMPNKKNPFGNGETALKFSEFDIFKKLRTLWQMTQLIMMKPENIRPNMDEQRVDDQTNWRIEPYGWDRKDREYYVLDDNRLYCLTAAPPPSAPSKKTSQKAKAALRAAKRRRLATEASSNDGDAENASGSEDIERPDQVEDEDPLGGSSWECIAITLDEVRNFLEPLQKTKDANEKVLRDQIEKHLLPILEKQEESRKRKMLQRERELLALEKMAHAKRSSRIAGRAEQRKHEEVERQEREKRLAEEAAARKEEEKRLKIERERDTRMVSREKRLREREARRIQHEEELAQLSEGSKAQEAGRLSERRLKAEIEKNKQALKDLEEEEDWTFDCVCGLHGQVDDGEHSVACERCNVWQHSRCLGIDEEEAERDDFHFICKHCKLAEREKGKPLQKPPQKIKIKLKEPASTSSTPAAKPISTTPIPLPQIPGMNSKIYVDAKAKQASQTGASQLNGVSLPSTSVSGVARSPEPSPQKHSSPLGDTNNNATASRSSATIAPQPLWAFPPRKTSINGSLHNPFSSPHPNLLPPDQSPDKSRAYGSIYNSSSPVAQNEYEAGSSSTDRPSVLQPTANANALGHGSPAKETKETSAVSSPQKPSQTPKNSASKTKVLDQPRSSPASIATPRLSPSRPEDNDPLPSSRGGISPTKNSPSYPRSGSFSFNDAQSAIRSSPAPAVIPPVAALPPSSPQIDLTPPVKHDSSPARPVSQYSPQPPRSSPLQSPLHKASSHGA
ncbi:hypothetical protein VM1G_02029 [Cytospora mali]|uniref:Zinc finger PHD-type domain-containing protein n=1 Tax=Cytospora mali TaxID=578113 RepID=A0A194VNI3_CYTMA|nr:hypothetical protein VM1G_02029 [Valsa mali]